MSIRTLTVAAILAASSFATTTAHAQLINDSFTYQGNLNDAGTPANGLYDITFLIYDNQFIGNIVSSATVNNVQVTDGLFETFVDFGSSGVTFDTDDTRWLQLRITEAGQPGFTTLAPRQRIAPAPVANYALRAGFAQTSGTTLQEAYDSGTGQLVFNNTAGPLELLSTPGQTAGLNIVSRFGDTTAILADDPGRDAALLNLFGPNGSSFIRLERDISSGGGGYLSIDSNDSGFNGFILEGNSFNQSPRMTIQSLTDSIIFDLTANDDDTVQLPSNAINAFEMLNEPGVAETQTTTSITLTQDPATIDALSAVTIQAPSSGFVLVIGSAELSISHDAGFNTSVNVGVSTNNSVFFTNTDLETRIPSSAATGLYDYTVTSHAIFSASEGSNTYYLLGDLNNSAPVSATVLDQQLSAIFIPTAYGLAGLQSNLQTGQNIPDEFAPISLPMTQLDILAEQNASLQADNARQQRELDQMRAQVQLIQEQLDNNQPRD